MNYTLKQLLSMPCFKDNFRILAGCDKSYADIIERMDFIHKLDFYSKCWEICHSYISALLSVDALTFKGYTKIVGVLNFHRDRRCDEI